LDRDAGDPNPLPGRLEAVLELFQKTFEQAHFSVCVFDAEGRYLDSNPAQYEVFGADHPPPEFSFLEDPLITAAGYKHLLEAMKEGQPVRIPPIWYDIPKIDPEYVQTRRVFLGSYVFPFKDERGEVLCYFVFHEDATEQETAREALAESEARFRLLVEKAPVGIVAIRRDGTVIEANPALLEILGSPSREATLRFNALTHPGLVEAGVAEEIRRCFETAEPVSSERPYATAWGKKVVLRYLLAPSVVADGSVEEVLAVVEDVTEAARAREEALRAERLAAAGSLAAGIVHDFGNMLTGIVGLARLLSAEPELGEAGRKRVETIREAGEEARDLVRRLKAVSREGGGGTAPVDLHETVRKVCALARHALAKSVRIEASLAAKGSVIEGDGTQLHRPLLNLAINAGQAMPEGGRLTFATADVEGDDGARQLELRVSDTGEGMAPELRDRIFEPFFTTREGEGAGLGLATVREAARRHGGAIRVDSAPGEGTTFTLRFPLTG